MACRFVVGLCVSLFFGLSFPVSIPVVSGNLMPGQLVSTENWTWGSWPDNKMTRFIVNNPTEMNGKVSRYIKKSGDLFYKGDLMVPDIIHNQDPVKITLRTGLIRVSVPGIALKDGALGCTIRVLNPATQKILDAVIIDSRNVEVLFN